MFNFFNSVISNIDLNQLNNYRDGICMIKDGVIISFVIIDCVCFGCEITMALQ